jgi:hypothetical protein
MFIFSGALSPHILARRGFEETILHRVVSLRQPDFLRGTALSRNSRAAGARDHKSLAPGAFSVAFR